MFTCGESCPRSVAFFWEAEEKPAARETHGSSRRTELSYDPSILHALQDVARRIPGRQALICEDRSLTFAEHKDAISGFARRLRRIGVEGERVAILMTNCLETPVCIISELM